MEEDEEYIIEEEEQKNQILEYLNHYGSLYQDDKVFNHCRDLGEKNLQYKPEKLILWFGEKNNENILAGAEITYRNIIDGTKREYKDGLGKKIKDKYTFVIKPTEYLTNFRIWYADDSIYRIYLQTNKGKELCVGQKKGNEIIIDVFKEPQIILFFHGNYNNYLTAFSPILIQRDNYIKILFEGYFLLKAFLRREKKREEVLKRMENGEFKDDEIALIRTCLLSDNPFNVIVKFCIV